ncbi:MAG: alpha/beta hydrolase-fold protein [Bacteroidota bacterium]
MKRILPLLLLHCFLLNAACAQTEPGVSVTIPSSILNETRKIQVYSPATSKTTKLTYPVMYVFDGESLYWPAIGALRFMNYSSSLPQMPEAIVVSISNTKRDRDMPVPQEITKTGGAKNFLRFLSEELLPYINKNYPVNGLNVLIGHSQGGLFVTYAGLEKSSLFPFILALDVPVTVNPAVLKDYQQRIGKTCDLNYFSGETLYGWGNDFSKPAGCNSYLQKRIEDETHETMPYKGIYEGLKFLFREHIPQQKDMPLPVMQAYYESLSKKYNCTYSIPAALLLGSASQKINVSKKDEALALIEYYEKFYGAGQRSASLMARANAITKGPDERIDFYLNHPGSGAEALKPFMGKWKGTLYVPGGMDTDIVWEIKKVNDKYIMDARIMDQFNSRSDFLLVTEKNELAWGRKHNSGGIYLSIGKLSADGQVLTGTEDLVGFQMPEGFPPFKLNSFEFKKVKE